MPPAIVPVCPWGSVVSAASSHQQHLCLSIGTGTQGGSVGIGYEMGFDSNFSHCSRIRYTLLHVRDSKYIDINKFRSLLNTKYALGLGFICGIHNLYFLCFCIIWCLPVLAFTSAKQSPAIND